MAKHAVAKCLTMLLVLALVTIPVLSAIGSLRPREATIRTAIQGGRPAAEVSSMLRRVGAEDRTSIWSSPEMATFFAGLTPSERILFLESTALPWHEEFWKATAEWSRSRRCRVLMRGVEASQFFGTLDDQTAESLTSAAKLEQTAQEGYGFLAREHDPDMRLRFQTVIEQMQLVSQSAK